jgi:hypothetical protein
MYFENKRNGNAYAPKAVKFVIVNNTKRGLFQLLHVLTLQGLKIDFIFSYYSQQIFKVKLM